MNARTFVKNEVVNRSYDVQDAALYLVWRRPEDTQPDRYQIPVSRLNAIFEETITWEDAEWQ
ncbi:hypothetical protein BH23CHL5_BH23CHL5_13430 [soil metagenome]